MIDQVPEYGDGGYWYVVPATSNAESIDPVTAASPGWHFTGFASGCAWYAEIDGIMMAVVRTPGAVSGIDPSNPLTVSEVLQASGATDKPFGRVGGR